MTTNTFTVGQTVIWNSAKGYTPANGETAIIDHIWPDKGYARLTLKLSAEESAAHPEFGGECSMCAPLSELTGMSPTPTKELMTMINDTLTADAALAMLPTEDSPAFFLSHADWHQVLWIAHGADVEERAAAAPDCNTPEEYAGACDISQNGVFQVTDITIHAPNELNNVYAVMVEYVG